MTDFKWPRSFRSATELPADQVAAIVEQLIAELDRRDGDVDLEDDDPDSENESRFADTAFAEWHTRGRHKLARGEYEPIDQHEDDEDDDPDTSVEDAPDGFDPEEDLGQDDIGEPDHDAEAQQMAEDVPCIPVYSPEPNIFNGQRQLLGYTLPRVERDGEMEL